MWNTESSSSSAAGNSIYQYLDTNGDGSGTIDAQGNYASATEFYITPQAENEVYELARLIINIEDTGTVDAGSYGNNISLTGTDGIEAKVLDSDNNVLRDLTAGEIIQTNGHWAKVSYDVSNTDFGAGANYVNCRWTFSKSGKAIKLDYGERLAIILKGNFTALDGHFFMIQGKKYNKF